MIKRTKHTKKIMNTLKLITTYKDPGTLSFFELKRKQGSIYLRFQKYPKEQRERNHMPLIP